MSQVDRLLLELHRIQQRLAEAPAAAEAVANKEAAGRDRYAVMAGHLEAVVQTAAERLDEVGRGLHEATRDPEPPEPGEADAYAVLWGLIDEAINTTEARQGWERALLEVLRDPRQRQVLINRLTERVAKHPDRCPGCGRELEVVEYLQPHPGGSEVRRERYCPVCDAGELALARQVAVRRAG